MIFFITTYDDAGKENLKSVASILPHNNTTFTQSDATRDNIIKALSQQINTPLFVMTHGTDEFFFDNNKAQAISLAEAEFLSGRSSFVYACYTSNTLGRTAAKHDAIYWGYTGAVAAPDASPETVEVFTKLFSYILAEFPNVRTPEEIQNVINELKEKCDDANHLLDEVDGGASSDSYFSVLTMWTRLRVHHYSMGDELIRHSQGQTDDLFEIKKRST